MKTEMVKNGTLNARRISTDDGKVSAYTDDLGCNHLLSDVRVVTDGIGWHQQPDIGWHGGATAEEVFVRHFGDC